VRVFSRLPNQAKVKFLIPSNKMGNKLASARALTILGYFFGPIFPMIGCFLPSPPHWLAYVFLALVVWFGIMIFVQAGETSRTENKAGTSGSWSVWALIYLAFLIYATVVVFRDLHLNSAGNLVRLNNLSPTVPVSTSPAAAP
jgi:hypothetical protein